MPWSNDGIVGLGASRGRSDIEVCEDYSESECECDANAKRSEARGDCELERRRSTAKAVTCEDESGSEERGYE